MKPTWRTGVLVVVLALAAGSASAQEPPTPPDQLSEVSARIAAREDELAQLLEKLNALREAQTKKSGEVSRLTDVVETLEGHVAQARLELDYTTVSIEEVRLRIQRNEDELRLLTARSSRLKTKLGGLLRIVAELDQRSPLEVLLTQDSFADFMGAQQAIQRLQARATALLLQTHDVRRAREAHETDLRVRRADLEKLATLQSAQRGALLVEERRTRQTLGQSLAEAARIASRVAEAEDARREIQQEIFSLKNSGIRLSLKQAEQFAKYAGSATGVRPALLLGVLKVESNVGTNVGSGRYPDDVHPDHREAFIRVVQKLGLDPSSAPVSSKPTTYSGWGGAMGPGQIMPGIWERVEGEVARITGKSVPSPYELLDAFVGTAVILRNAGADGGNEYEAINRYFAGPNWQRFTWYGDRVLAVAKEYESRGL